MIRNTVTVGTGKAIHWGSESGTMCGAAHRNGFFAKPKQVKVDTATCKRCIKIMATEIESGHAEAIALDEQRYIARAFLGTPSGAVISWDEISGALQARDAAVEAEYERHAVLQVADVPTAAEIDVEQLWTSKLTGVVIRIADANDEDVQAYDVADGKRFWIKRSWVIDMFTYTPEAGTEGTVPNTVEAWAAYADRVKASRDAAEAEVARLLRGMDALAGQWERAASSGVPVHQQWACLRALAAGVGK